MTGLTDEELAVLTLYADGDAAHNIAHDLAVPVSAVRGIVHRACGFDRRRAANLVAHARGHHLHAVEEQPEPPPPGPEPEPGASVADFVALGISYRQLDYWSRRNYLHANAAAPGTGNNRTWPLEELAVAGRLIRLLDVLVLKSAVAVARGQTQLAPGVHVHITDNEEG